MTVKTDTIVNDLVINTLTSAEYAKADSVGEAPDHELYRFTDEQISVDKTLKVLAGDGVTTQETKTSSFDNAVACWHFEDNVLDSVGNASLVNQGVLVDTEHKFGTKSLYPNNVITPLEAPWHFTESTPFTLEFWLKSGTADGGALTIGFTGVQFSALTLLLSFVDGGFNGITLSSSDETYTLPNTLVVENEWNHYALTYNGDLGSTFFINGTKVAVLTNLNVAAGFNYFRLFRTTEDSVMYVDEIRITNKVQFVDNFKPANVPYEKSMTVVNTDVTSDKLNTELTKKQNTLTSLQLSAVNSGINANRVNQYDAYDSRINNKQDILEAGDNIEITGNVISANIEIPDSVYSQTNLVGGKDIEIVKDEETSVYKINTTVDILTVQDAQDTYATLLELAAKRDSMDDVEDSTITEVNLAVVPNTNYEYGTLTALNIISTTKSYLESTIFFTAGVDDCLTYPSELKTIGTISIKEGKSYAISILNNIMVIGELN